ncbi:M14 family zinc carboxypeptidase [Moritella sp. Urea-trap-13]|uniref:M14 family zinc carboxypeptidase n=1 Tax=Moritella sp. Urea-trap-13 TaxID=2058327 RepID=UPI000C333F7C|nr:M14 family zinc carboxypeptidase [Moritella sp. Urea-trap-13]PKH05400.1 zinc carboxypeptidase [Moritella sp. Urea-trap-13]
MPLKPQQQQTLPELVQLERLIALGGKHLHSEILAHVSHQESSYPLYSVSMGSQDPNVPVVAFIGGIHGVERIGTQVILALFESLIRRLNWDQSLHQELNQVRLVFLPLMNPIGMLNNSRANGNGIDLMRNAPIDAVGRVPWLVGGQRISPILPWYRGKKGKVMEHESRVLVEHISQQLLTAPFSIALDCHSGFGFNNQLWFPYAKSKQPIPHLAEIFKLRKMLIETYPHQDYVFEPQARNYMTHGDLWDYLYDKSLNLNTTFLPLTLEMGSWTWIKKNPLQVFQSSGIFHPIEPHRIKRVLRQHHVLMEFLIKVTSSYTHWLPQLNKERSHADATSLWYTE